MASTNRKLALIVLTSYGAIGSAIAQVVDPSISEERKASLRAYAIEVAGSEVVDMSGFALFLPFEGGISGAQVTYEPVQVGSVGCLSEVATFDANVDDGEISWTLRSRSDHYKFWETTDSCSQVNTDAGGAHIFGEFDSEDLEHIVRSKESLISSILSLDNCVSTVGSNSHLEFVTQNESKGANYYRISFWGFACRNMSVSAYVEIQLLDRGIEILDTGYRFRRED